MPRTKMPKARTKAAAADSEGAQKVKFLKNLRKTTDDQIATLRRRLESELRDLDFKFQVLDMTIDDSLLNKTMRELRIQNKENTTPDSTNIPYGLASTVKKTQPLTFEAISQAYNSTAKKTSSSSKDDGYITESSETSSRTTTRMSRRRSRSAAATCTRPGPASGTSTVGRKMTRKRSSSINNHVPQTAFKMPRTLSQYRTPAYKGPNQFAAVTPKIVPDAPMSVLRRPRHGEMVMSMTGSPLLVSQMQSDETANCNIPLFDGTTLCMLPELFPKSKAPIPSAMLGPDVLKQIKTLHANLETIFSNAELSRKK